MEWTAEFVEKGYNNRAAVPQFQQYFDDWAARSAVARAELKPAMDLRYGPGPRETLDLFLPQQTPRATLLFFHGGYWRSLDKASHSFIAPPFVERGYAVAVANYDLCPSVTVAEIVDEARRAFVWLRREGAVHGANTERIVLAGHSAGGHLVAMLHATNWLEIGLPASPFAAGVTLSGVHDLRPIPLTSFNADIRLNAADAAHLSPILLSPRVHAPLLVAVGANETSEFVRQSQILWDAWPGARPVGSTRPLVIAGRHHFSVLDDMADSRSKLAADTLALLGNQSAPSRS
jgi:arylformamidase